MKKFIISALFLLGFGSYAIYNHTSAKQANGLGVDVATTTSLAVVPTETDSTSAAPSKPVSSAQPPTRPVTKPSAPTPAPVPETPRPTGKYVDGVYTGNAADAYYGYVQVRATISGGKLTNIAFLQYPNDRQTSVYISQQALPMLRTEAIEAQSANVDGVSGASDTSQAFVESLGSALAQAKA
ncbi:MAG: FMN-binding protein [Bacillota bacterium]